VWSKLFRRMMGYSDWNVEELKKMLPWNPATNGLRYLYDYSPKRATEFMTDPNWTRAIFVREPKSRFLSAYLDKGFHPTYMRDMCCRYSRDCVDLARTSLEGFLQVVYNCSDSHWRPQNQRMQAKYWPYINFVGHMESVTDDAKRLLKQIGAWEHYGQNGWGLSQNDSIFESNDAVLHKTNAMLKLNNYYNTSGLIAKVESFYAEDYANPYMNITRIIL
jgi:Sulfotransferase family